MSIIRNYHNHTLQTNMFFKGYPLEVNKCTKETHGTVTVPWVCLQCVIVIFPDYAHLPFNSEKDYNFNLEH